MMSFRVTGGGITILEKGMRNKKTKTTTIKKQQKKKKNGQKHYYKSPISYLQSILGLVINNKFGP